MEILTEDGADGRSGGGCCGVIGDAGARTRGEAFIGGVGGPGCGLTAEPVPAIDRRLSLMVRNCWFCF